VRDGNENRSGFASLRDTSCERLEVNPTAFGNRRRQKILRNFAHFVRAMHEIRRFRKNIFRPSTDRFFDHFESPPRPRRNENSSRRPAMPQSIELKNVRRVHELAGIAAGLQAA
jgi:hypothetical protein